MRPYFSVFLIALLLSIAGCRQEGDNLATMATGQREQLTVLTFNLWHGLNPTGNVRFDEHETAAQRETRQQCFYSHVRRLAPDIVFLQEVNPAPGKTKQIARFLGYNYAFIIDNAGIKIGAFGLPVNLRSGLAILAKKDLRLQSLGGKKLSGPFGWTNRWSSLQLKEFRQAVAARVVVNDQPVLLAGLHLHHGPEADEDLRRALAEMTAAGTISAGREQEIIDTFQLASQRRQMELRRLWDWAGTLGANDTPMLLAGDFNASPDAPEMQHLKAGLGFASTTGDDNPADLLMTWDYDRNPNTHYFAEFVPVHEFEPAVMRVLQPIIIRQTKRLDYILYRRFENFFILKESGLFAHEPCGEIMSSDHFGIYACFQIAP